MLVNILPYMTTQNIFIIGAAILLLMMIGFDRIIMLLALAAAIYFGWPYIRQLEPWIIALAALCLVFRVTIEWAFENNDNRLYRRHR